MKKTAIILASIALAWNTNAQNGAAINTDGAAPHESAILDVQSNEKGFLPPRMTTDQRNGIDTPAVGLTIFNTDVNCLQWWNGIGWFDSCERGLSSSVNDCPQVAPYLSASQTIINDVINPTTGKTWMDRNLGAHRVATSSTDCWAYGNTYQWGRAGDGHESRSSTLYTAAASTGVANFNNLTSNAWYGQFVQRNTSGTQNWINTSVTTGHDNLWQGVNGVNNPCPSGYRVPTSIEWQAEINSWSTSSDRRQDAFNSFLKIPSAGIRGFDGIFYFLEDRSRLWSSTIESSSARFANITNTTAQIGFNVRSNGLSVRCIKN